MLHPFCSHRAAQMFFQAAHKCAADIPDKLFIKGTIETEDFESLLMHRHTHTHICEVSENMHTFASVRTAVSYTSRQIRAVASRRHLSIALARHIARESAFARAAASRTLDRRKRVVLATFPLRADLGP